jgi:hypothetical protein
MSAIRQAAVALSLGAALLGCGGSLKGNNNPDGATTTIPCEAMGACECMAASDRCAPSTEPCWCPSECNSQIACVCGGGRFLSCQERTVITACTNELAAVQAKCANHAFVRYIDAICVYTNADPNCTAACLAQLNATGSCSEIDCRFCTACDCAVPTTPSRFADCLQACRSPAPDRTETD